jgi:hypothetical protein
MRLLLNRVHKISEMLQKFECVYRSDVIKCGQLYSR